MKSKGLSRRQGTRCIHVLTLRVRNPPHFLSLPHPIPDFPSLISYCVSPSVSTRYSSVSVVTVETLQSRPAFVSTLRHDGGSVLPRREVPRKCPLYFPTAQTSVSTALLLSLPLSHFSMRRTCKLNTAFADITWSFHTVAIFVTVELETRAMHNVSYLHTTFHTPSSSQPSVTHITTRKLKENESRCHPLDARHFL